MWGHRKATFFEIVDMRMNGATLHELAKRFRFTRDKVATILAYMDMRFGIMFGVRVGWTNRRK